MTRRQKLRSAEITLAKVTAIHERIAIDAPEQLRVAPVDVQDPYNPEETIRVVRSTKDPLTWLHYRGAIDEPQRIAGERWRKCWFHSHIGLGSVDTTREAVDGGKIYEPIPDLRALEFLAKCRDDLGRIGNFVIERCLADNLFPDQIANLFGFRGERATRYYTRRIREALQTIATVGSRA